MFATDRPERLLPAPRGVEEDSSSLRPAATARQRRSAFWLVEAVALLAAGLIILRQVLGPPVIGLANNSDWGRLMAPTGLGLVCPSGSCHDGWVPTTLSVGQPVPLPAWVLGALRGEHRLYLSSELLPVYASLAANSLLSPPGRYDLRVLGVIHAALVLLCAWTLLAAARALGRAVHATLCALLVAMSTDVSYVQFFNSLYAEPTSLACLWLVAGISLRWLLSGRDSVWLLCAFHASALLLVVAKPQNLPLAAPLALLGLWAHLRTRGGRPRLLGLGLPVLLCAVAVSTYLLVADRMTRNDLYNLVFSDLLKHSPDPEADLEALGLDPVLVYYVHTMGQDPMPDGWFWDEYFFQKIGYAQVLRFYATHPGRLVDLLRRSSAHAFRFDYQQLGNYEQASGMPAGARSSAYSHWTRVRAALLQPRTSVVLALLGAGCLVGLDLWRRRASAHLPRVAGLVLLLPAMAALQFGVAVLAAGEFGADLSRHLFLFNALSEWIGVVVVLWGADRLWELVRHGRARLAGAFPMPGAQPAGSRRG